MPSLGSPERESFHVSTEEYKLEDEVVVLVKRFCETLIKIGLWGLIDITEI